MTDEPKLNTCFQCGKVSNYGDLFCKGDCEIKENPFCGSCNLAILHNQFRRTTWFFCGWKCHARFALWCMNEWDKTGNDLKELREENWNTSGSSKLRSR